MASKINFKQAISMLSNENLLVPACPGQGFMN
jgi:hypothetical protein